MNDYRLGKIDDEYFCLRHGDILGYKGDNEFVSECLTRCYSATEDEIIVEKWKGFWPADEFENISLFLRYYNSLPPYKGKIRGASFLFDRLEKEA